MIVSNEIETYKTVNGQCVVEIAQQVDSKTFYAL